jgi:hypothetical protein
MPDKNKDVACEILLLSVNRVKISRSLLFASVTALDVGDYETYHDCIAEAIFIHVSPFF